MRDLLAGARSSPRSARVSSRGSREPRPSRAPTSPRARARAPSPIPRRDRPTSRFRARIPHPGAHPAPPPRTAPARLSSRILLVSRGNQSYRDSIRRRRPSKPYPDLPPARPLPLSRASPPRRGQRPSLSGSSGGIPPPRSRRYSPTRPPRPPRSRRNSASCAPTSSPSRSAARCSDDEAIGGWWSVSPPDSRRWPLPNPPRRRRRLRQPRAEAAEMARGVHGVPAGGGSGGGSGGDSGRSAREDADGVASGGASARAQLSRRLATTSSSSSCAARFGRTRR